MLGEALAAEGLITDRAKVFHFVALVLGAEELFRVEVEVQSLDQAGVRRRICRTGVELLKLKCFTWSILRHSGTTVDLRGLRGAESRSSGLRKLSLRASVVVRGDITLLHGVFAGLVGIEGGILFLFTIGFVWVVQLHVRWDLVFNWALHDLVHDTATSHGVIKHSINFISVVQFRQCLASSGSRLPLHGNVEHFFFVVAAEVTDV